MAISPRTTESIALGGGRHYKGRGLGTASGFKCVACGAENAGRLQDGCVNCGAGKPGQQVRKPGDRVPDGAAGAPPVREEVGRGARAGGQSPERVPPVAPHGAPASNNSLRIRAQAVDYDEIERRVAHALEQRLGGGYSDEERLTLYQALEVYINAWDDGLIEPTRGLNMQKTRELAQRVLPDDMELPDYTAGEAESNGDRTDSETETASSGDTGDHAPRFDDTVDTGYGEPPDDGGFAGYGYDENHGSSADDTDIPGTVSRPTKPAQ